MAITKHLPKPKGKLHGKRIRSRRTQVEMFKQQLRYALMRVTDYVVRLPLRIMFVARYLVAAVKGELMVAYVTLRAVKVIGTTGERVDCGIICRKKVTQAFVKRIAAQMAVNFSAADAWKYHDSGTGTTAENNSDTALQTPTGISRVAGTQVDFSTGTTGNYRSVGTITYNNTYAITEHGLFQASTSGTLLDRSVFSAINVVNTDKIEFTYELTLNPES